MTIWRPRLSLNDEIPKHKKVMNILKAHGRGMSDYVIECVLKAEQNTEEVVRGLFEEYTSKFQVQAPPRSKPVISDSFMNNIVDMQKRGEKQNSGH